MCHLSTKEKNGKLTIVISCMIQLTWIAQKVLHVVRCIADCSFIGGHHGISLACLWPPVAITLPIWLFTGLTCMKVFSRPKGTSRVSVRANIVSKMRTYCKLWMFYWTSLLFFSIFGVVEPKRPIFLQERETWLFWCPLQPLSVSHSKPYTTISSLVTVSSFVSGECGCRIVYRTSRWVS